jgi:hypothetical protein
MRTIGAVFGWITKLRNVTKNVADFIFIFSSERTFLIGFKHYNSFFLVNLGDQLFVGYKRFVTADKIRIV